MSPQKKNSKEIISTINPILTLNKRIRDTPFAEKERVKEKRITLFHFVIHILAFLIIIPFIVLIIYSIDVPPEYGTIVSIVIGFYFGRVLFKN